MSAGGGTQQSFRKALGALKDSTKVGLAKVNNAYKELDVAIVKATNHLEVLPKEKHIRTIFDAVSASRPRADVAYCINALARRLAKTHNWAVALKTLIVIHRALREVDPTIREELINYSGSRGHMLNLSHFKDDSSPNAWDCSAWVRSYALYLEECLECCRILKYDVQTDSSRTKELHIPELLEQLHALQQILFRLLGCQPEGMARYNYLIQYALSIVAAESVKIYVAITDGTLNLIDKFFEMQRHDAVRALEIYRKAGDQAESLSEFFEICRGLGFGRGQKYIKIEQPPASFMTAMEEYAKEAPQTLMLPWSVSNDDVSTTLKAIAASEPYLESDHKQDIDGEEILDPSMTSPELPKNDHNEALPQVTDLLGWDELTQEASEVDGKMAIVLGIPTSVTEKPSNSSNSSNPTCQSTSWELELVTVPSSNEAAVAESKLVGGLDRLTLDSLYDDALARTNQNGTCHTHTGEVTSNPFEATHYTQEQDLFYTSSNIAPPTTAMQLAVMESQHESFIMLQQQQQQPLVSHDPTNPFRNPFIEPGVPSYPSHTQSPGSELI